MDLVKINDIRELIIDKSNIIIYQNNGGIIEFDKNQIDKIGNITNYIIS